MAAVSYEPGDYQDRAEDLDYYGWGMSYTRVDHTMRRNPFANNWTQLRSANNPFFGGVPQIAFSSARVQRGEVLPTLANNAVGIASYPGLSAVISPMARFFLPAAVGTAGAAVAAGILAVIPAYGLGKAAAASVRWFGTFGYRQRHVELGGDYTDTETAYNLRMRAISDISSAMSYSRRWLGNEALFMRQQ